MSDQGRNFGEMSDERLDQLLASARWPAPDAGAERRLASCWRSLRHTSSLRYWAIAAGVLIAFGVWGVWRQIHRAGGLAPDQSIVRRDGGPAPQRPVEVTKPADEIGRPPTAVELAMFRSAERPSRSKTTTPPPDVATFVVWRAVMMADEGSDDAAIRLLKRLDARVLESRWPGVLRNAGNRKTTVARLIGATATPQSLDLLMKLDALKGTREAAVAGLARVAPPALLVSLAKSHADPSQRRQLITALLRRDQSQMAGGFLELVRDPAVSEDALACLDEVRPGTDAFFARLDDRYVAVREAAALVLGRIDGPQTTARLIAMASHNRNRREALIALADSRGRDARQFLLANQTSGPLAGPIRSVLLQQAQNQ